MKRTACFQNLDSISQKEYCDCRTRIQKKNVLINYQEKEQNSDGSRHSPICKTNTPTSSTPILIKRKV
jgi:hypothetical protein